MPSRGFLICDIGLGNLWLFLPQVHPEALGWGMPTGHIPSVGPTGEGGGCGLGEHSENRRQGTQPGDTPPIPIQPRSKTIKEESTSPGK